MSPDQHSPSKHSLHVQVAGMLRRHALLRSITYGVGINAIGYIVTQAIYRQGVAQWSMNSVLAVHTLSMPLMGAFTYSFITLRDKDIAHWNNTLGRDRTRFFCLGTSVASIMYITQIGVAWTLGWVSFPTPGWHLATTSSILQTLITHLANICVAFNEEMLYRGYGLDSLREAVGLPIAVSLLIPLFAYGHGSGWQTFLGQSLLGVAMTGLRLASGSLWMPIGYHAAWNYIQTAVLGPIDASPSLLPMRVEGPVLWMGRPGYPEPGLLSTITHLFVVTVALLLWWRSRSHSLPKP